MGGPTPAGRRRLGIPMGAGLAVALVAVLATTMLLRARRPEAVEGPVPAPAPSVMEPPGGDPEPPAQDQAFAGCYDLSAQASVPAGRDACLAGADTLVPANSLTAHMVDLFLGGAEVRIRRDLDGSRTLSLKGYESPDELLFLDPPAASKMPPPQRTAAVRKPRPPRQPPPPSPEDDAGSLAASRTPSAAPPPIAAQIEEELDTLSPEASLQLPVPRAVDGPSSLTEGSPSLERMLEGMSRQASRMECGPEGCVCKHPPCVPCPLETSRLEGVDGDTWAVRWIVWYATEATRSERFLGIRMLTTEERDLIRQSKFRWGYARSLDAPVGQWDWAAGRIPASLVAGAGGRLNTLQAQGARLIGAGPTPSGDLRGALEIVVDRTADAAARVHALRWLGERGGEKSVGSVLRELAVRDPDESIRAVAMDALDSLAARTGEGRRPSGGAREPVTLEPH